MRYAVRSTVRSDDRWLRHQGNSPTRAFSNHVRGYSLATPREPVADIQSQFLCDGHSTTSLLFQAESQVLFGCDICNGFALRSLCDPGSELELVPALLSSPTTSPIFRNFGCPLSHCKNHERRATVRRRTSKAAKYRRGSGAHSNLELPIWRWSQHVSYTAMNTKQRDAPTCAGYHTCHIGEKVGPCRSFNTAIW